MYSHRKPGLTRLPCVTTCKSPPARGIMRDREAPKEGTVLLPKRQREGFTKDLGRWWWENRRVSTSPESARFPTCAGNSHAGFYEVRGAAGRHFPSLLGRLMRSPPWQGQALQPSDSGQQSSWNVRASVWRMGTGKKSALLSYEM